MGIKSLLATMGNGLAFSFAGEMLMPEQKEAVLSKGAPDLINTPVPRVILAFDGGVIPSEMLEKAIFLTKKHKAVLDMLVIQSTHEFNPIVSKPLARLTSEYIDFRVTQRQGDFWVKIKQYANSQSDTAIMLIHLSDNVKNKRRVAQCAEQWGKSSGVSDVNLYGNSVFA